MNNPYINLVGYGLRHLPEHLRHSELWVKLDEILTDFVFIETKCAAGLTYGLVNDYAEVLAAMPGFEGERKNTNDKEQAVKAYTEKLMSYARGEIETLPVIFSIKPKFLIKNNAEAAQSSSSPNRYTRLTGFSQFVSAQAHNLNTYAKHGGFCAQQAFNYFNGGPVALAAEQIVRDETEDIFFLLHLPDYREAYDPQMTLSKTMVGHEHEVKAVVLSADAKTALSCGIGGKLRVWNVELGNCQHVLAGHSSTVRSVALSADGRIAVSVSIDDTIKTWDTAGRRRLWTKTDKSYLCQVALTSDGRLAYSINEEGKIKKWQMNNAECHEILQHKSHLFLAISADGRIGITGGRDKRLSVWDMESRRGLHTLMESSEIVRGIAITPDGRFGFSAGSNKNINIWDIHRGKRLKRLVGHQDEVTSVSATADGRMAASASWDNTIRIWDVNSGKCLRIFRGHSDYPESVVLSVDGRCAVSGGSDRTLRVWDVQEGEEKAPRKIQTLYPGTKVHSADGKVTIEGLHTRTLEVNKAGIIRIKKKSIDTFAHRIKSMSLSSDGRIALIGLQNGELSVWETATGNRLRVLDGHTIEIRAVALSGHGDIAISAETDGDFKIWDVATGKWLHSMFRKILSATSLTSGPVEYAYQENGHLTIREKNSGRCLHSIKSPIQAADLSEDGMIALTGNEDGEVQVWDVKTGLCLRQMKGHSERITAVKLSDNGCMAVSGSWDRTIRVWNVMTGDCVGLAAHHSEILTITISKNIITVEDWTQARTLFEIRNFNCQKSQPEFKTSLSPPPLNTYTDTPDEDYRKQWLSRAEALVYKIRVQKKTNTVAYFGQSMRIDDAYVFENIGPLETLEELLHRLDKGLQNSAIAHEQAYTVNKFDIYPEGAIERPKPRFFYPLKRYHGNSKPPQS